MWIGHMIVGLVGKIYAPRIPTQWLILAGMFCDALFSLLLVLYVEDLLWLPKGTPGPLPFKFIIPFSHSLLTTALFSAAFGAVGYSRTKNPKDFVVLFLVTMSHFVLDLISHRGHEMQLYPNGPGYGFGSFNHVILNFALEGAILFASLYFYFNHTRPTKVSNSFVIFAAFAVVQWLIGNWMPLPDFAPRVVFMSFVPFMALGYHLGKKLDGTRMVK